MTTKRRRVAWAQAARRGNLRPADRGRCPRRRRLTAGVTGPPGSPVGAIGAVAVNHAPVPVKEFAIAHFG